MSRKHEISVRMYFPRTDTGRKELAKRISETHANTVLARIKEISQPDYRLALLDAVINTVKHRSDNER